MVVEEWYLASIGLKMGTKSYFMAPSMLSCPCLMNFCMSFSLRHKVISTLMLASPSLTSTWTFMLSPDVVFISASSFPAQQWMVGMCELLAKSTHPFVVIFLVDAIVLHARNVEP